jgi:oligopeptide/dipeptide ABC transporter ATP-binding protein
MSEAPLLELQDLEVGYPISRGIVGTLRRAEEQAVRAVDGVSFSVSAGELVALVGESGCGKTTTAQTIMRLVDPTAGSVRFRGRDLAGLSQRALRPVRREMQIIFQDPYESLDPRFRVRQTVEEPLVIHGLGSGRADRAARVRAALERAGLTPADLFWDRFPHELSGGQRQRVAIASALVLEPQLLIADEPVSMLDVSVRAGVLSLLDELRRDGLGILMITHDLATAAHYADRVLVMYLGRIVEQGPARAVIGAPAHPYTRALVSVVPRRDPRARTRPQILTGETPDPTRVPAGCRFHPRCPVVEPRCLEIDPSLVPVPANPAQHAACVRVGELPERPSEPSAKIMT